MKLWENAWAEFGPPSFDVEIRKVICSTNAIKSVNARMRKAVRARGHFPDEATPLANLLSGTGRGEGGEVGDAGVAERGAGEPRVEAGQVDRGGGQDVLDGSLGKAAIAAAA